MNNNIVNVVNIFHRKMNTFKLWNTSLIVELKMVIVVTECI